MGATDTLHDLPPPVPNAPPLGPRPLPGSAHAHMYGVIPDPPSLAAHSLTTFDMDVAEWVSTQSYAQFHTQLPIQTHYAPQY
jgi:hypothetical protein